MKGRSKVPRVVEEDVKVTYCDFCRIDVLAQALEATMKGMPGDQAEDDDDEEEAFEDEEEEEEDEMNKVEAEDELEDGDVEEDEDAAWRTEGSEYLGKAVRRSVYEDEADGERWADGSVVGWLSAEESDFVDAQGKPAALYRVEYNAGLLRLRGEREDLEESELKESLLTATACPLDDEGNVLREPKKSDYELLRESNIQRNRDVMMSLGLVADPPKKKKHRRSKKDDEERESTRKSPRIEALRQQSNSPAPAASLEDSDARRPTDEIDNKPTATARDGDLIDDDEVGLADELDDLAKTTHHIPDVPTLANDLVHEYAPWSTQAPSTSDILGFIADYESRRARPAATTSTATAEAR